MSFGPKAWIQQHWDARAAPNFMLGGARAGLLIAAALAYPASRVPVLIGLGLIAAGRSKIGEAATIIDRGTPRPARVCSPRYYDPDGTRLHG